MFYLLVINVQTEIFSNVTINKNLEKIVNVYEDLLKQGKWKKITFFSSDRLIFVSKACIQKPFNTCIYYELQNYVGRKIDSLKVSQKMNEKQKK